MKIWSRAAWMRGRPGYILKDSPPAQLTYAIQAVSQGQQYMSPRVLTTVVRQFMANPTEPKSGYDLLSDREREILVLLAEGSRIEGNRQALESQRKNRGGAQV